MALYVRHFRLTCELANSYVACDGASGEAWLVDVGEMSERLIAWLKATELRVSGIFITHAHYDHNGAVADYLELLGDIPVYGGSKACGGSSTVVVKDGDNLHLGQQPAQVLATPGHTPEHLMLYFPEAKVLFSGDALFAGSVGGTNSEALRQQQRDALCQKVLTLPDDVSIYPGHGPPTSVAIERAANPFLR